MDLLFLGTASGLRSGPYETPNFDSNMLLTHQGKRLLIDCGVDIQYSLTEAKINYADIDAIYISHLHIDHAGGLEWLALTRKFKTPERPLPTLYVHESMINSLWQKRLAGGLSTLKDAKATINDFFNVEIIKTDAPHFIWQDIPITLIKTLHYYDNQDIAPSFGLTFCAGNKTVLITTDTQFTPDIFANHFNNATIIFHECDIGTTKSSLHANYDDLCTLQEDIKQKMWLYHYDSLPLPNAVEDGFAGFVMPRQNFHITN